jgi:NgoMIV restriction enzyme
MSSIGLLSQLRNEFHKGLTERLLVIDSYRPKSGRNKGVPLPSASNADGSNESSRFIANHIANALGAKPGNKLPGQSSGNQFEIHVANYLSKSFSNLPHIRPGDWEISVSSSRSGTEISAYEQYEHVGILREK